MVGMDEMVVVVVGTIKLVVAAVTVVAAVKLAAGHITLTGPRH